jgi:hypothetical protein
MSNLAAWILRKLERERQALEIKLHRTEKTPVQYNWAQVPLAYARVSGIARQTTSVPIATSRQELVKAANYKDLQPPKEQRGSVSAGADPSKKLQPPKVQQLAATVGISPLLKLTKELTTITGNVVVPVVGDSPVDPYVQRPRTRSVSRIVPPDQSLIADLWVPDRGAIRPQVPRGDFDSNKPPFSIVGKSLHPVVERYDQGNSKNSINQIESIISLFRTCDAVSCRTHTG